MASIRFAAKQLTELATPFGVVGIRVAVYVLAAFLSLLLGSYPKGPDNLRGRHM